MRPTLIQRSVVALAHAFADAAKALAFVISSLLFTYASIRLARAAGWVPTVIAFAIAVVMWVYTILWFRDVWLGKAIATVNRTGRERDEYTRDEYTDDTLRQTQAGGNPRMQSLDAIIDEHSNVILFEPFRLPGTQRPRVTEPDEPALMRAVDGSRLEWPSRYKLLRILGRGGMGRTVLCRDRVTHRLVCIKELVEGVDRRVLQQECRALSRLSHPNIVRLLDFEVQSYVPFLVMEFVNGLPIDRYVQAITPPNEAAIASIVRSVFEAVGYLHSEGIIHRDLKPDNILMSDGADRARPVLIDFGLAIVDMYDFGGRITAEGCVVGTLPYMAPEQLAGQRVGAACDIYALGILLFELLTGRPAFEGTPQQVLTRKLQGTDGLHLPPLASYSPALRRLVLQCTNPEAGGRPSIGVAMAVLDQVANSSLAAESLNDQG